VSRYIDEHRGCFGVEPICRTLDVSASAYYQGFRPQVCVSQRVALVAVEQSQQAPMLPGATQRLEARDRFGVAPPLRDTMWCSGR